MIFWTIYDRTHADPDESEVRNNTEVKVITITVYNYVYTVYIHCVAPLILYIDIYININGATQCIMHYFLYCNIQNTTI